MTLCSLLVVWATRYAEYQQAHSRLVPFLSESDQWIDSTMRSMSRAEKIMQLMLLLDEADSAKQTQDSSLADFISEYSLGGVVFSNYLPEDQYNRTREMQLSSKHPLLIGMYANSSGAFLGTYSQHAFITRDS